MTSAADESAPSLPRERLAVAALATAAFCLNLNTNVLGALLPFVQRDLGLQPGEGASLIAAAAAGSAVGALLVGPATVRFGRRAVLLLGLVAFALASVGHLLALGFVPFAAARAVAGLAVGLAYASASALIAEIVPYERRGAALGRFNAGMFLAIPVGMPLSVVLANSDAWRGIFAIQAALGIAAALLALRAIPAVGAREARGSTVAVLKNVPAMAALLATLLHVGSFFTTVQLAAGWLDRTGRVAKEHHLWIWVGLGLASVLGSALLGKFADGLGKRRFVLWTSLALVATFAALAADPVGWLLAGLGVALAVVAAARTGPLQALVSGLVPSQELAALMGLRGFAMQAGVVGFALAAGPLEARFGFSASLWLAAACQAASFVTIGVFVRGMR